MSRGQYVAYHLCADGRGNAVGFPEFVAHSAGNSGKKQVIAYGSEVGRSQQRRIGYLKYSSSGFCAIGTKQFVLHDYAGGDLRYAQGTEKNLPAKSRQLSRFAASLSRNEIFHQYGACGCAVRFPEFGTKERRCGGEKYRTVYEAKIAWVGTARRVDVFEHNGRCIGAGSYPELAAMQTIVGAKKNGAVHVGHVPRISADEFVVDVFYQGGRLCISSEATEKEEKKEREEFLHVGLHTSFKFSVKGYLVSNKRYLPVAFDRPKVHDENT